MPAAPQPEPVGPRPRAPASPGSDRSPAVQRAAAPWVLPAALLLAVAVAAAVRWRGLDELGLSSDEAVYLGQARQIEQGLVPDVRAHAPLFALLLRVVPGGTHVEPAPRAVAVVLGLVAVVIAGLLAREVAGRVGGALAAVAVATMPYHADVTRLALVDVPMATTVAVALLLAVRAVRRARPQLLEAAAAVLGVATLFKETAALVVVGIAVAALVGGVPAPRRTLLRAASWYAVVVGAYPAWLAATGGLPRAVEYLRWQLSRTSPTGPSYVDTVLPRMGWALLAAAAAGAALLLASRRREGTVLVLAVAGPALFHATWPTTAYPYLLVLVVPVAALAACGVVLSAERLASRTGGVRAAVTGALATLVVLGASAPAHGGTPELPGASGVPAVREAARWLGHAPGPTVVTGSPWLANVVRAYLPGRHVVALSRAGTGSGEVNPAYRSSSLTSLPAQPVVVVWDAWTASTDPVGTARLLAEVRERGGRVAHVETGAGGAGARPLVVVHVVAGARDGGGP